MTTQEFQEILDDLEQGMTPELTKIVDGQAYTRVFLPENRLILLGGGHIAVPLCAMASMLDFAVTVVDDRISFANSERFPQAAQVICNSFAAGVESLHNSCHRLCLRHHPWAPVGRGMSAADSFRHAPHIPRHDQFQAPGRWADQSAGRGGLRPGSP